MAEAEVIRQLEARDLLRYRTEPATDSPRIIVDTAFNLGMNTCTIVFDANGIVTSAYVDQALARLHR